MRQSPVLRYLIARFFFLTLDPRGRLLRCFPSQCSQTRHVPGGGCAAHFPRILRIFEKGGDCFWDGMAALGRSVCPGVSDNGDAGEKDPSKRMYRAVSKGSLLLQS